MRLGVVQLEQLMAPIPGDSPTGVDMFEDAERQEIEAAFEDDPANVDWRAITGLIEGQCGRTKDVWLAVYLARAGAQWGRLDTVVTGCELLAGLFETYWTDLHPSLDEYGFQGRKGPCESLTRIGPFLGPLKRVKLVEHARLGSFGGEDLMRFEAEGAEAQGYGMFRKAVEDAGQESLQAVLDQVDALRGAIQRADRVLVAQADGDTGTDFTLTYQTLDAMRRALAPYAGVAVAAEAASDAGGEGGGMPATGESSGPRIAGKVDSRDDVLRALDAVADYYIRREPGSPIPVAIKRVRGWVGMDFMSILKDISPNSVTEAGAVLLAREIEDDSSGY
jgi:type VI secretion system ImpA family protein